MDNIVLSAGLTLSTLYLVQRILNLYSLPQLYLENNTVRDSNQNYENHNELEDTNPVHQDDDGENVVEYGVEADDRDEGLDGSYHGSEDSRDVNPVFGDGDMAPFHLEIPSAIIVRNRPKVQKKRSLRTRRNRKRSHDGHPRKCLSNNDLSRSRSRSPFLIHTDELLESL